MKLFIYATLSIALFVHPCFGDIKPRYRVGVILPLTGDGASWGVATKNGIEIALAKLTPELRARIDLIVEDDALQPKNTISIFRRLTATEPLDALINVTSGTGNAVAPLAEKAGITFFSIASDGRIAEGKEHVFMFYLTPEDEIRAGIDEMVRRGYKRVAEVVAIQEGYMAGQQAFRDQQGEKLTTVFSEQFPPELKDFRSPIAKLRRVSPPPDAVLVLLMPGQVGLFARQLREAGMSTPMVGGINFENRAEVQASNGALVGQWFITNASPSNIFMNEYTRLHPEEPLASATNGHDAIAILAQALEANIPSRELPAYLRSIETFEGASGTLRMDKDGRFRFPASIKEVTAERVK